MNFTIEFEQEGCSRRISAVLPRPLANARRLRLAAELGRSPEIASRWPGANISNKGVSINEENES